MLARILAYGQIGDDFAYLAGTPAKAAQRRAREGGKSPEDVDLWEINEAFASVALNSVRMLGIDEDKVNVNGGAIALGHPIGASGGRIIGALVHELASARRRPGLRRDLLRRRPGRRHPHRGLRRARRPLGVIVGSRPKGRIASCVLDQRTPRQPSRHGVLSTEVLAARAHDPASLVHLLVARRCWPAPTVASPRVHLGSSATSSTRLHRQRLRPLPASARARATSAGPVAGL